MQLTRKKNSTYINEKLSDPFFFLCGKKHFKPTNGNVLFYFISLNAGQISSLLIGTCVRCVCKRMMCNFKMRGSFSFKT